MHEEPEYDELVMTLVESALGRPAGERDSFLRTVCGVNSRLYEEVRTRIGWEERMGAFLREPLLASAEVFDQPFDPGELIGGRFRILRAVGRGGMGIVYEALDVRLDRRIAIKCARLGFGKRLPPEARAAREVSHFNVCKVYDLHSVEVRGRQIDFLTMEFIDGETLSARLRKPARLSDAEIREIVLQVVAGLSQAHKQGVVHGDLKPGNVILTRSPAGGLRTVLTDFGLAKLHGAGAAPLLSERGGTLDYMAPELFLGGRASAASDIYALGVLIHELVTGRTPRRPEEPSQPPSTHAADSTLTLDHTARLHSWHCETDPLPAPWRSIVVRCVKGDPSLRFKSVEEIAARLRPATNALLRIGASVLLLVMLVALALWQWRPAQVTPVRLAVLPIQVEGDPTTLASAVADDVASRLSGIRRGFTVFPPGDAHQLALQTPDQAAKLLGASHVLITRVRHQGRQFLVHAGLVDTGTGQTIRSLDGTYKDNDPGSLAKALLGTVTNGLAIRPAIVAETVSPPAYADYVQGIALLHRDNNSADAAIPLLTRAMQLDPRSALPAAALAEAQLLKYNTTHDASWYTEAKATAAKARSLNPDSASVLILEGSLKFDTGSYEDAARDYQRATELEPLNVDAWQRLALAYGALNRPTEALATYKRLLEVQPNYFRSYLALFNFYFFNLGQYAEAEAVIRKLTQIAPGLDSGHTNLGTVLVHTGRYEEARAELKKSLDIQETKVALYLYGLSYNYEHRFAEGLPYLEKVVGYRGANTTDFLTLGNTYRFLGREADARQAFRRGLSLAETAVVNNPRNALPRAQLALFAAYLGDRTRAHYEIAQARQMSAEEDRVMGTVAITYEALGERDQALASLQRSPKSLLEDIRQAPQCEALQRDPRFQELLNRQSIP